MTFEPDVVAEALDRWKKRNLGSAPLQDLHTQRKQVELDGVQRNAIRFAAKTLFWKELGARRVSRAWGLLVLILITSRHVVLAAKMLPGMYGLYAGLVTRYATRLASRSSSSNVYD